MDDFMLPIRRRGKFLSDNFFQGFQNDFDSAMQNVMSRFGGRSLLADRFADFRTPRSQKSHTDDSISASISENRENYVIVLDVSEFINGNITVKTRGQYAVIEASYKSKSFSRKFSLPKNTNFEGVTSAMSDEGILTVTAPKKGKTVEVNDEASSTPQPSVKTDKGESISDDSPTSSDSEDKNLSISKKGKFFQDSYFEKVLKDFEEAMDEQIAKEDVAKVKSEQQQTPQTSSDNTGDTLAARPEFSRLNSYRNLREWAPMTETQAVTITRDGNGFKIVMDVKHFVGGEGKEINIKGSEGGCTVTGSNGPISFKRDFNLPGLKDPSQLEASVSEDGILTILAKI